LTFFSDLKARLPGAHPAAADQGPFTLAYVLFDELKQIRCRRKMLNPDEVPDQPTIDIKNEEKSEDHPTSRKQAAPVRDTINLPDYYRQAHAEDLSAICLSGGGIRSAAFAFGVIQALADFGVLKHFDFLSTVSGGGYAGSFLTAWAQRTDYNTVSASLVRSPAANPESPIAHVRRYSKYLTPHSGFLSADVLAVVALFARNLFLNWLIIFPFIVSAVLFVKLAAVFIWWLTKTDFVRSYPVLELTAVALIGVALVDSLRQRPGWESEKSEHLIFSRQELTPMCIGAFLAGIAVLRFGQGLSIGWTTLTINIVGTATSMALTIWLTAYYFSHKAPQQLRSTELAIEGSPRHAIGTAIGFTISGTISGLAAVGVLYLFQIALPHIHADLFVVVLGLPLVISCLFLGELVYTGLVSDTPWADGEREWLARASGYHGLMSAFYFITTGVVLVGSQLVFITANAISVYAPAVIAAAGGISAIAIAVLGKAPATAAVIQTAERSLKDASYELVLAIATPVFIVSSLVLISAGIDYISLPSGYLTSSSLNDPTVIFTWCIVTVGLFALAYIASVFVNINRFSLHNVYRNRLIRTFLGASNVTRHTNKFTDFDERDNLRLCNIWPGRGHQSSLAAKRSGRTPSPDDIPRTPSATSPPPNLLVINMALNVLATADLNLQERRALPFFATPRWIGSSNIQQTCGLKTAEGSFRRAEDYADAMTLGTAITISGAAASPNMGYHSSPSLGVLLTLFNVRLGAWLGNPGPQGKFTYTKTSPKIAAFPLIREALGLTTSTDEYVYLSDGGHFENLGVYEMLRRRCRYILVSDAGCDPSFQFEDLGSLVRKAYIDFGIEIKFRQPVDSKEKYSPYKGAYLAVADVHYPKDEVPDNQPPPIGVLLYLKPGVYGNEPASVRSYWNLHPEFPHEPTTNQWFGESQFEAYRALGTYAVQSTLPVTGSIATLFGTP
jgi:Patatin-like phospholipase